MTIRNWDDGAIVDVEDDGRRLKFDVISDCCADDDCDCTSGSYTTVVFDKAELLALLTGKSP